MQAGSITPAQAGAARSCLPGFAALSVSACQVEAERAAWQLAEALGLDVVTILPNFVLVGVTACRPGQAAAAPAALAHPSVAAPVAACPVRCVREARL